MDEKNEFSDFAYQNMILEISSNDQMLNQKRVDGAEHYFSVGRSAIQCIQASLKAAGKAKSEIHNLLDFPCGHGRVLRCLRVVFPDSRIVACDLLKDGVDFCANKFGATPVYSNEDPKKIKLSPNDFDLIWVGSLFTHFDDKRWLPFLSFFGRLLRPRGLLIFSTHGIGAYRKISEKLYNYCLPDKVLARIVDNYLKNGFGYANYMFSNRYGISLSSPRWVESKIQKCSELSFVSIAEAAYDNHQDIVTCIRK